MSRKIEEWIGKTDDSKAPLRVRLRVFETHCGMCHFSGRKIRPGDLWDLDHIIALCNGGENRESNLAPVLKDKHKEKTKLDLKEKAKVAAVRSKHLGIKRVKQKIPSRGFRPYPSNTKQIREDYPS